MHHKEHLLLFFRHTARYVLNVSFTIQKSTYICYKYIQYFVLGKRKQKFRFFQFIVICKRELLTITRITIKTLALIISTHLMCRKSTTVNILAVFEDSHSIMLSLLFNILTQLF